MISTNVPALSKVSRKFFYANCVLMCAMIAPIAIVSYQGPIELCQHIIALQSLMSGTAGATLKIMLTVCFVLSAALSRSQIMFISLLAAFGLLAYEQILLSAIPNGVECAL